VRDRRTKQSIKGKPPSRTYVGHIFEDRQIVLDDSIYDECIFRNVIFRWDGGEFAFVNSRIEGPRRFETNDRNIRASVDLLKSLGFLSDEFAKNWKHLELR
jgi:hypothetical protein